MKHTSPSGLIAGVELGGTKCIVVLADREGTIREEQMVPTTTPEVTLGAIGSILLSWWSECRFDALGIASFGPLDLDPASARHGYITTTAKPGWQNTSVMSLLSAPFDVPVAFDTDVNGAAMAERTWGAATNLDDFAYVTVGTGVGVGLIVNGRPTRGLGHCEAGHMHVARLVGDSWPGACPYHGACVEGLASGPAIAARAGLPGSALPADHPVWDGVVEAVAQMAQALIFAAGPRRFLMGGGVLADRQDLIARIDARVRTLVGDYLTLPPVETGFVRAPGLGTRAGPLGPIALALESAGWADRRTAAA